MEGATFMLRQKHLIEKHQNCINDTLQIDMDLSRYHHFLI